MPKSKSTRGKRMKNVIKHRMGVHPYWISRFNSALSELETRLYLQLHLGKSSVADLVGLLRWIHTVQFIILRRTEQFKDDPVLEWFKQLDPSVDACWNVIHRATTGDGRCICTGDELKEITAAIPPVFDFIRAELSNSPNACILDWYAVRRLATDITKKHKDGRADINPKLCQKYHDRVARDLLSGKLQEESYLLVSSEEENANA